MIHQHIGIFMGLHAGSKVLATLLAWDVFNAGCRWLKRRRFDLMHNIYFNMLIDADDLLVLSGRLFPSVAYHWTHEDNDIFRPYA